MSPSDPSRNSVEIDPITQQIVANSLSSIADDMATTLFRTAYSTVVRDGMDFSAALTDPSGQTIAQAVTVPFHLGSIPVAMESLIARYGESMRPGDVFIMNDPFDGGIHLPDIFIARPIYLGERLIGFGVTTAHHGDVGGRVAGSSACDNTEIFQEGIRIPWMHFYRGNERVQDIVRIIEANVRVPNMTLGDINAQVAAAFTGEKGLLELAVLHGPDKLEALLDSLLDYSERLVRNEISSWPDGVAEFTDFLDSDGLEIRDVVIHCRLEIRGDSICADFSESSDMVRGSLNSTRSFIQAAVYQAIRCALTVDIPNTSGMFRPIDVITRPGSVTHVVMPGASSMRGVTGFRAFDALSGALAQLVPDRVPAAGEGGNTLVILTNTAAAKTQIFYELVCGTWGGTPLHDGNDGISNPSSTAANIPVEVAEREFPMVIEQYGLVCDSGGAGQFRGGLAIHREWRPLSSESSLTVRSDRQVHPPYGLSGGSPGRPSQNVIIRQDRARVNQPPMFMEDLRYGERFYHRIAGGGGWGDPYARDPNLVAADVLNEKVSREMAASLYGVIVAVDNSIDWVATETLRQQRARLPRS